MKYNARMRARSTVVLKIVTDLTETYVSLADTAIYINTIN